MMPPSNHLDPTRGHGSGPAARERIDALLDEALQDTFPASDSSAIGSRIAVIEHEHRYHKIIKRTNVATAPMTSGSPALSQHADRSTR